jgi:phosphoglycolate phosphatase-like HAD superfamily hydrolase
MSTIIFDFDGTLADSMPLILTLFSEITHRPTPPDAEIERLRQLPIPEVIRELKVPLWRVPMLLARGRAQMTSRLTEVKLFAGVPQMLETLHRDGHVMFIVSSNSARNVHTFLRLHELEHYFVRVYGGAGLMGKAQALRKIMRQNHINPMGTVYIGDEVRDVEAAAKVGINDIAVTWGFNGEEALRSHNPYAVARHPSDIPKLLTKK